MANHVGLSFLIPGPWSVTEEGGQPLVPFPGPRQYSAHRRPLSASTPPWSHMWLRERQDGPLLGAGWVSWQSDIRESRQMLSAAWIPGTCGFCFHALPCTDGTSLDKSAGGTALLKAWPPWGPLWITAWGGGWEGNSAFEASASPYPRKELGAPTQGHRSPGRQLVGWAVPM